MSIVKFKIQYNTKFGEEVYICGSAKELGSFDISKAVKLYSKDGYWTLNVDIQTTGTIEYYYLIKEHDIVTRKEWGKPRKIHITKSKTFKVTDYWKDKPFHEYLYTSVFTKSVFSHKVKKSAPRYYQSSVVLNVMCPFVKKDQQLVITGNNEFLGYWNLLESQPLDNISDGEWQIVINTKQLQQITEYKLVIVDSKTKNDIYWEYGDNRVLKIDDLEQKNHVQVEMALQFNYESFSFKGIGTAIPIFSLRSNESFGIGDFSDLKKMVDWAAITNQQMIQILPINDTTTTKTWRDSYPYNAISSYALHPIYLGLNEFPLIDKDLLEGFKKEAEELNSLQFLDYEKVFNLKSRYTKLLFEQDKNIILSSKEFKQFYKDNQLWLFPYSIYCYLRDKNNTAHFPHWGEYSKYDESKLKQLIKSDNDAEYSFNYYIFLQYLLDKQLKEATQYAHSKGIALKGDIPIGINRDSVEAWTAPHLFNMDTQTGAPPDDFSTYGQNWGFPTYNWKMMEHENFDWWKNRFLKMADYFDAYRIDHILGFFRIWEIPIHSVQGLLGQFSPAMPYWPDELRMAGIPFDEDRMTKPFIHESFLNDTFGEFTDEVKQYYLENIELKRYILKEEFNTQRKIQHHFGSNNDTKSIVIRDGLYQLCNEVLFVEDRTEHNKFHPRITAYNTYSYRFLDDNTKNAFNKLYEDFFYHRHNYFWREEAMRKLPSLISSTQMLCCGEDLGMVPDCVPSVMSELKILSLEIQRMPKDLNVDFTQLDNIPYLSVCTTSTHDMPPIRLWWEEAINVTQSYYNNVLQHYGDAPSHCSKQLCHEIVMQHVNSSAMWVILPWQDWISISDDLSNPNTDDERINIPSNPNHYWRWRMHITLDKLIEENSFNEVVASISMI